MGQYIYEANGKRYRVTADSEAEAYDKFVAAVPQEQNPAVMPDVGKGLRSGLSQGSSNVLGTPGSIYDTIQQGIGWAGNKVYKGITGEEPKRDADAGFIERMFAPNERGRYGYENPITGNKIRGYVADASHGMSEYRPKTFAGKVANTTGRNIPGAMTALNAGGTLAQGLNTMGQYALAPAIAEETASWAENKFLKPRIPEKYQPMADMGARILGSFAGPVVYERGVNRLLTPNRPANPVHQGHAQRMEDEGVELSAGQRLNNSGMMRKEVQKNSTASDDFFERQQAEFTRAVTSDIPGFGTNQITDDWIRDAGARIGDDINSLARSTAVRYDQPFERDIRGIYTGYVRSIEQGKLSNDVRDTVNDILKAQRQNGGILTGRRYQDIRSTASKAMREAYRSDNYKTGAALRNLIDSMDDAMERTMTFGRPDLVQDWQQARRNWRSYITIVDAASAPGKTSGLSSGYLNAEQLRGAVGRIEGGREGVARAAGNRLRDLAVSGQATMKMPNSSGTAENVRAGMDMVTRAIQGGGTGGYIGGLAASGLGLPPWVGAVPGSMLGGQIGKMTGDAMLSPLGIRYQTNQFTPPQAVSDVVRNGLIPTFLAAEDLNNERHR